jgi:mRNA interferase MazF
MTTFEPGDVVLVRFPFTDLTTLKKRPALIVSPSEFSQRNGDVVIIALTGQAQPEQDVALQDWRMAGLLKPTWLKPLIGTVAATVIDRRLGKLSSADHPCAAATLRTLISPAFMT